MDTRSNSILISDLQQGDVSYPDFLERVGGRSALITPVLRSRSLADVFCGVVQAYAFEQHTTLLDHDFSDQEVARLIEDVGAVNQRKPLETAERPEHLNALLGRVSQSQSGTVALFTSGTTGRPTQVVHRFETLARGVKVSDGYRDHVWGFAYNPTHVAGLLVFLQAFMNGNRMVNLFGYPPDTILQTIRDQGVTHLSATPTFYRQLLPTRQVAPLVRRITFGGERFDRSTPSEMATLFPNARVLNVYASTEAGSLFAAEGDVFSIREEHAKDYRIEGGQLYIHKRLLGGFNKRDDWFATGDMVEVVCHNPLGFRFIRRAAELANVGGYKVNPHEVEEVMRSHASVRDARVYAKPNPVVGALLLSDVVSTDPTLTEPQLREYLDRRLQPHKIPRVITFVDELEVTRSGKIQR